MSEREKLQEMVGKWRKRLLGLEFHDYSVEHKVLLACADELEQILAIPETAVLSDTQVREGMKAAHQVALKLGIQGYEITEKLIAAFIGAAECLAKPAQGREKP